MNFRIAVKGFIIREGKLLLVKRRSNDVQTPSIWEIPGGRLELGENPFEGLKREVKEETNLDVIVGVPLGVKHFTRKDEQTITMIIFLCEAGGGEVKLSEEHTDYKWVEMEKAREEIDEFFVKEVDAYLKLKK